MTDYQALLTSLEGLLSGEGLGISALSNASALLYQTLPDLNWAGFYLVQGEELILGPFQGKVACTRIPLGRGVCGHAWKQNRVIVVPDVHAFPGHIACDGASRSEIVLPIYDPSGAVRGVLDIDSPIPDRFSPEDEAGLRAVADCISAHYRDFADLSCYHPAP